MKEQQRFAQENTDKSRSQDRSRQEQTSPQAHAARLPAQQWARLLRQGENLQDLPVPLLEQLAEAVGNSSLTALLRQSGGGDAVACMTEPLCWDWPEPEVNHIRTAPPALLPFEGWPQLAGLRPRPSGPCRVHGIG